MGQIWLKRPREGIRGTRRRAGPDTKSPPDLRINWGHACPSPPNRAVYPSRAPKPRGPSYALFYASRGQDRCDPLSVRPVGHILSRPLIPPIPRLYFMPPSYPPVVQPSYSPFRPALLFPLSSFPLIPPSCPKPNTFPITPSQTFRRE